MTSMPRRRSTSGKQSPAPLLLPTYPGLDGGSHGHWGNQNEESWADRRWNETTLGSVLSGVFRGAGVTVPKGICIRLGDRGEMSACFNPETLCYEALWRDGFVKFSATRHGFHRRTDPTMARPCPARRAPSPPSPSSTTASTGMARG